MIMTTTKLRQWQWEQFKMGLIWLWVVTELSKFWMFRGDISWEIFVTDFRQRIFHIYCRWWWTRWWIFLTVITCRKQKVPTNISWSSSQFPTFLAVKINWEEKRDWIFLENASTISKWIFKEVLLNKLDLVPGISIAWVEIDWKWRGSGKIFCKVLQQHSFSSLAKFSQTFVDSWSR